MANINNVYAVTDFITGSTGFEKSYETPKNCIVIANDGTDDVSVTINGFTIVVKAGEIFDEYLDTWDKMTVTATTPYRIYVRDMRLIH